jgi:hypothetical protein
MPPRDRTPPKKGPVGDPVNKPGFTPDLQDPVDQTSTTTQTETDKAREERVARTGTSAELTAQGVLPANTPQIPKPATIGREDTEIAKEDVPQMGDTERGVADSVDFTATEAVSTGTARDTGAKTQVAAAAQAVSDCKQLSKVCCLRPVGMQWPHKRISIF